MNTLVEMMAAAAEHPEVVAAHQTADCSVDFHRAAVLLELGLSGFDHELADTRHGRDGRLGASMPYPDTAAVLNTLSFEHGLQKPDLRLFQLALEQLGVTAAGR